jgi:Phosphoribosyl transferase domain
MPFKNRREAGRRLAVALAGYKEQEPTILALPRGGVAVAAEVAAALKAPLDLILVRKVGVRRRVEDHRPAKVRCRTKQRRTKLARRGVNATVRLRFLDPMAARAGEKSVAFPWQRRGLAGRYKSLQDGRPTKRALLRGRPNTREPAARSGRGSSYRYMHGHC